MWYAVKVKTGWKSRVIHTLENKGLETVTCERRGLFDAQRIMYGGAELPDSYLFVKVGKSELSFVQQVKGVDTFLYWFHQPAVIHEEEIFVLKYFSELGSDLFFERIPVNPDGGVVVTTGPFLLKEGEEFDVKSKAIKAELPSMGFIVATESNEDAPDPLVALKAQPHIRLKVD